MKASKALLIGMTCLGILLGLTLAPVVSTAKVAPSPAKLNISGPVSITTVSATDATARINLDCCTAIQTDATLAAKVLIGQAKTDPVALATQMSATIQALADTKQPISTCSDDPTCQVDPKRCDLFWQVINGTTYLVGRNVVITISWDGTRYNLGLRNPC